MPRIRDHDEKLAEAKADPPIFDNMRRSIARRARGQKAPYNCIAAVEAACTMPFDEGIARERELFDELENSAEARALRYAFFAEREVAGPRHSARYATASDQECGHHLSRTMGGGIAMSFAEFGFPVKILEQAKRRSTAARPYPRQLRDERQAGQPPRAEMKRRLALIEAGDQL